MSRLQRRSYESMTDAEKEIFDRIAEGRTGVEDGHIGGPFDAWILSPEMARRIAGLGDFFRFRTSVDRRYIELAILMTGSHWQAQYEWYAHEPMAREAGLPEGVIRAVKIGNVPEFQDEGDRAVYYLCRELLETHQVSDESYERAETVFGEHGVSELVNVCGYYVMVSMTLNTFQVRLPGGAEYPFPVS